MKPGWSGVAAGLLAPLVLVIGGAAQELDGRVAAVKDGWVTFQVEVDDDVEVCDRGIRTLSEDGDTRMHWQSDRDDVSSCGPGPLQVELEKSGGRIVEMRTRRVNSLGGATALGMVDAQEASDFLVSLAYADAVRKVAEEGFAMAQFPRGADPSRGILRAARDRTLDGKLRRSAIFWAGQLAADEVVGPLAEVAREDAADQDVRDAAVFALSQHQGSAAVSVLMELATDAPHPRTRRSALFWLAQHDDERVVEFLADIILGRGGR